VPDRALGAIDGALLLGLADENDAFTMGKFLPKSGRQIVFAPPFFEGH